MTLNNKKEQKETAAEHGKCMLSRRELLMYSGTTVGAASVVSINLTDPSGSVIKTYTRQEGVEGYGDFDYWDQWKMFGAESLNITPE